MCPAGQQLERDGLVLGGRIEVGDRDEQRTAQERVRRVPARRPGTGGSPTQTQTAHTSVVTTMVAVRANGSALRTRMRTPEIPIATGTPIPSTAVWTDSRARSGSTW